MNPSDRAERMFADGYCCSQAICATFSERFGLDPDTALRLAQSFGGGMARRGLTCGAVTGALMVIGLARGATDPGDEDARDTMDELSRELMDRITARFGSIACDEIVGIDSGVEGARHAAREDGSFDRVCPGLIRETAEILDEILNS